MTHLLPKQVYAGLFEIVKDDKLFYHSTVSSDYSKFTDEGNKAVLEWMTLMAPHMRQHELTTLDAHAKKMMWKELKS